MNVIGADLLRLSLESDAYFLKLLLNDTAAHFFAHTTEHRDATQPGLCYKDDSQGNALAAVIKPKRVDFRFHRAFSDEHVAKLARKLIEHPEACVLADFTITYQGRTLIE